MSLHNLKRLDATYAIVLFKVDGELGNHDGVLHVHLHPVQPLNALLTGVPWSVQLVTLKV